MGLYDYINGEQIKCFYRPIFSEGQGVWHSGGRMIGFSDGDEIPVKSMYYKYPDNFMIFDYMDYSDECYIHIIKDKKVFKTCTLEDIIDDYFKDNELVVDYHGTSILNIKSVADIKNYIVDTKKFSKIMDGFRKESRIAFDNFMMSFRLNQDLEATKTSKEAFELINEDNFNFVKSAFEQKEITTYSKLNDKKDILLSDIEYMNDFHRLINEVIDKEFYRLDEECKLKDEEVKELTKPYKEEYYNKWFIRDEFALEKDFGEYLDCIIDLYEEKDKECSIFNNMERYISCKEMFNKFIEENKGIKEKYIKWSELDEEEIEILDNILNTVL